MENFMCKITENKKIRIKLYIILLAVFLLSFGLFSAIPGGEALMKNIAAIPALSALIAAIYQVTRDHSAHIKRLEIQQIQQNFSLGVSSHMAEKAFDKHLEFCEKYIAEVHKTSETLWREGSTEKALEHGRIFSDLRIEYSTWITDDISKKLTKFEDTLYKIGSRMRLVEKTHKPEIAGKASAEADKAWEEILGRLFDKNMQENDNVAIQSIINKIRNILGVNELIELRGLLIRNAITKIKNT